jgi:polyhydroxyalkanoate synthesis regulator protein
MVPDYLEGAMESFRSNQDQFKSALAGALSSSPFGELHKRNMEMFEAATSAFRPSDKAAEPKASTKDDEIADLKAQLAALQEKVEKLG